YPIGGPGKGAGWRDSGKDPRPGRSRRRSLNAGEGGIGKTKYKEERAGKKPRTTSRPNVRYLEFSWFTLRDGLGAFSRLYSYLNARMGLKREAFNAGQRPARMPTMAAIAEARMTEAGVTLLSHPANWVTKRVQPLPQAMPTEPPMRPTAAASIRNWERISNRLAPMAFRRPISL